MSFNYAKLKGRIKEKCGSQREFAAKMGLSERTISLKLDNKIPFTQKDIVKSLGILNLTDCEISEYFFAT